ncbi:MAG TPA: type I restriction enzyme HsdR N-terminal domain-containing protein [Rhabdochlamydiaceae bacterium]|nr:type I restriction enzyme HsdR N-terminal domain-containing protein [Rhabdochlamydiaceae bacterium]
MNTRLVFDEVRKAWVAATPEEIVRQQLLQNMIHKLDFPKDLLSVEKDIRQLPHLLTVSNLPDRRADIICFAKDVHPQHSLYPLLLIECKEECLDLKAQEQLLGYNHYIKAHFVALAGRSEVKLGYYNKDDQCYRFIPYLPSYKSLLSMVQNASL